MVSFKTHIQKRVLRVRTHVRQRSRDGQLRITQRERPLPLLSTPIQNRVPISASLQTDPPLSYSMSPLPIYKDLQSRSLVVDGERSDREKDAIDTMKERHGKEVWEDDRFLESDLPKIGSFAFPLKRSLFDSLLGGRCLLEVSAPFPETLLAALPCCRRFLPWPSRPI